MHLETKVAKWGNSIGIRIPSQIAARAGIAVGNILAVSARDSEIVLVPHKPFLSIDARIRRISKKNLHHDAEWLSDTPVGKEII